MLEEVKNMTIQTDRSYGAIIGRPDGQTDRRTDSRVSMLQSTAFIPVLAALLVVFHWSSHLGLSHLLQRSPGFFVAFVINRVGGHNLFFFFFWLQTTWLIDDFLGWR